MRVRYNWKFKAWVKVRQEDGSEIPYRHVIFRYLRGAGWMKMEVGLGRGWQPVL